MSNDTPAQEIIDNLFSPSDNFNLIVEIYDSIFFKLRKKTFYNLEGDNQFSPDKANYLTISILSNFFNITPYDFTKALCVISAKYHPEVTTSNILSKAHDHLISECQENYHWDSVFDPKIEEYSAKMHNILALHDMI